MLKLLVLGSALAIGYSYVSNVGMSQGAIALTIAGGFIGSLIITLMHESN